MSALDALIEPTTRGDPMSPLRWTTKSTYWLSDELKHQGHDVSQRTVCDLLGQMGFSLQSTRKSRDGGDHEDRDAQFAHIAKTVADYQTTGHPVISVDTKKKELFGDFKNAGREYQPIGTPEQVRVHDFIDSQLGQIAGMGLMTWQPTPDGSMLVSTTILASLPQKAFDAGGARWVKLSIRVHAVCS